MNDDMLTALHARSAERSAKGASGMTTKTESKSDYRKKQREKKKREHVINILWRLDNHGIKEASARQIAGDSDYCYSGNFSNYLNALCDEGYLCLEVYPYAGGCCTHRFTYMLPVNAGRKERNRR